MVDIQLHKDGGSFEVRNEGRICARQFNRLIGALARTPVRSCAENVGGVPLRRPYG
jgi:hypothetical protein